jgi:hypothetical protein
MLAPKSISKPRFMSQPTFDEVVFGSGASERRFTFEQFCQLPLKQRVELLLQKPRYYRRGELIQQADAMSFRA